MSILIGVQRDYNAICAQPPIGIEIDNSEGIDEPGRSQIQDLNDLAGLLEFRNFLEELNNCPTLTPAALGRILPRIRRAEGNTVVERFLYSLQQACRDQQCSGLPPRDRSAAIERLDLLYEDGQAREIRISERRLTELGRLEGEQSQRGIERTLSAVNVLISRLSSRVDINEFNLTIDRVNEMLREQCQEGVAPAITPPPDLDQIEIVEPPPDGSETPPQERNFEFGFLMDVGGGYFYDAVSEPSASLSTSLLDGDTLDRGPGISARVEAELRYNRFRARLGYEMVGSSTDGFAAPRSTADQFVLSALYEVHEDIEVGGEVEVNWQGRGWIGNIQSFRFTRNLFVDAGTLLSIAFAEGRGAVNVLAGINIITATTGGADVGGRVGGYLSAGGTYRSRGRLGVTWDGGYSYSPYAAGMHRAGIFAGMPIDLVTFGPNIRLTLEINAGLLYRSLMSYDILSIYGGATFSLGNLSRLIRRWGVF